LEWQPPKKVSIVSEIQRYNILFDRVDPQSKNALLPGTEETITSLQPGVVLQGLAAGAAYKIQIKVITTSGMFSTYSQPITTSTLRHQSDLEIFRESLNLDEIESSINSRFT
jgi:hypothetical protein